jgi:predicted membrane protein
MNINTIFLLLLVIAAYVNLYLTFNKRKQKKKTKLPISSKEWREKVEDENFKSWLSNRERLKDKRKESIDQ